MSCYNEFHLRVIIGLRLGRQEIIFHVKFFGSEVYHLLLLNVKDSTLTKDDAFNSL